MTIENLKYKLQIISAACAGYFILESENHGVDLGKMRKMPETLYQVKSGFIDILIEIENEAQLSLRIEDFINLYCKEKIDEAVLKFTENVKENKAETIIFGILGEEYPLLTAFTEDEDIQFRWRATLNQECITKNQTLSMIYHLKIKSTYIMLSP